MQPPLLHQPPLIPVHAAHSLLLGLHELQWTLSQKLYSKSSPVNLVEACTTILSLPPKGTTCTIGNGAKHIIPFPPTNKPQCSLVYLCCKCNCTHLAGWVSWGEQVLMCSLSCVTPRLPSCAPTDLQPGWHLPQALDPGICCKTEKGWSSKRHH